MGNNLPNFAIMTQAELSAWAWKHSRANRTEAATILPGRPRGYVAIVQDLAQVALCLSLAIKAKEEQNHREAVVQQAEAERLWVELPDFARPLLPTVVRL